MATICLISPGHLTSNPRLVKEADALSAAGHAVRVIHGRSFPPHDASDLQLSTRGWQVAARVPFGVLAPAPMRWRQRARQKLSAALARLGCAPSAFQHRAWHPAASELIRAACTVPADLYVAHYPAALPAAALAARQHGARYAFDAEDFHPGEWSDSASVAVKRRLLAALERRWLPGCRYITAASPGIAEAYASHYDIEQPTVVRNVFPRTQAPGVSTPRGSYAERPSLYWFSQTIGPDRGLELAIDAIAISRSQPLLVLRGICTDSYRQQLEQRAAAAGISDHLHVLPHAFPEQMEGLAAMHDLGLVAETGHTLNRRIALTNKLYTYALAGVPALMSDIPAHCRYASEAGSAVRLFRNGDATSLASAIDYFLDDSGARLAAAREAAFSLGQRELNWERERAVLTACVAEGLRL